MVWEADIYYHNERKYGGQFLDQLTGDTIDTSEWMEL